MTNPETADLTAIAGVGPKTAERLHDLGYDSAKELAIAYLTDDAKQINRHLHNSAAFHRHLAGLSISNEELGIDGHNATDIVRMMILARERDAHAGYLADDITERPHLRNRHPNRDVTTASELDGLTVRPTDIDFDQPMMVTADQEISYGPSTPVPTELWAEDDYEPAQNSDVIHDERVRFESPNSRVDLRSHNIETVNTLLDTDIVENPERVLIVEEDTPVRIDEKPDEFSVNAVHVAPHIP